MYILDPILAPPQFGQWDPHYISNSGQWNLLQIRPEPCSEILFYFIFTRPEPMHLDRRCDTGMHESQSESYSYHTTGIQEIQHISMQACNTHDSCCPLFNATSTAQWQPMNNGISKPVSPLPLPHSTRGITVNRWNPLYANHAEKPVMVSLSVFFFVFLPHSQCFLTAAFSIKFQFCLLALMVLPKSTMGITPAATDLWLQISQRCRQQWVCLLFLSPHSKCFLTAAIFN
jgi:hypothetical protein